MTILKYSNGNTLSNRTRNSGIHLRAAEIGDIKYSFAGTSSAPPGKQQEIIGFIK
jgi:hypothetical protein